MGFGTLGSGGNFYKKVMSFNVKKTRPKKKPAKQKKIKRASKTKTSLFSIFGGSDANFLSDHRKQAQYFKHKLKGLSKDKLKKLKQRIQVILEHAFEEHEPNKKIEQLTSLTRTHIELKLLQSETHISDLKQKIVQKLCRMKNPTLERSANRKRYIYIDNKRIPIKEFANDYFLDIIKEYQSLINKDSIIADSQLSDGTAFLCHVITQVLE